METARTDIYQRVTDQIVEAIERGVKNCRLPWHCTGGDKLTPINAHSKRQYRGVNVLCLWATAEIHGYETGLWATYKQWADLGGQVRKNERSTLIVFWKFGDVIDSDEVDDPEQPKKERLVLARGYPVFNAAQVTGYTPKLPPPLSECERIQQADAFFSSLHADIRHGGDQASYNPASDSIQMPAFGAFLDAVSYYSVLSHEATHWTAAPHRLNRDLSQRFGEQSQAMEELIAELGAAFLCADLGLTAKPRPDHAAYIASWLTVLKKDKRAIFSAASKAQAAVDWMHSQQAEEGDGREGNCQET